jgi:hypothetical protein
MPCCAYVDLCHIALCLLGHTPKSCLGQDNEEADDQYLKGLAKRARQLLGQDDEEDDDR